MDNKLSMSKQCSHEPTQDCSAKGWASRLMEVIFPLCWAVLRSHLGFWIQSWSHQYKTDMGVCTGANPLKAHKDVSGIGESDKVRGWESQDCLTLSRESSAGFSPMFINVSRAEVKKMYSNSSHWCSVKGWMIYNTFPLNTSEQLLNSTCCHMLEQVA